MVVRKKMPATMIIQPSFNLPYDNRMSIYSQAEQYKSGVSENGNQSFYQSFYSNNGPIITQQKPRIREMAVLTGKANYRGPDYGDPDYIAPKHIKTKTRTSKMISNPNDLMHTFSLHQMLMSWRGIYIKQKVEFMEAVSGCETNNKYVVYERGPHGRRRGKEMLKCREYSGCCARTCMTGGCRPFKMRVFNLWNHENKCLEMDRDCQCTFLCFNRPAMKVFYTEDGGKEYVGRVVDNFDCCNHSFDV